MKVHFFIGCDLKRNSSNYEFVKLPVQDILQQVQELSEMFCEYKKHMIPEKATGIRDSI